MSRAHGKGIEIGCGDDRNLEYLGDGVSLAAIEPDGDFAAAARHRAHGLDVSVIRGIAERIDVPSNRGDFVVSTLTACTVGSLDAAFREAHRVLKVGGILSAVEHNLADTRAFAARQRTAGSLMAAPLGRMPDNQEYRRGDTRGWLRSGGTD